MAKLIHGGDVYTAESKYGRGILDYSANINPLGMPPKMRDVIARSLDECVHYPDPLCRELRRALAMDIVVPEDYLIFGNGAADLIFRLVLAVKPKNALVSAPTFAEYEQALETVDCQTDYFYLEEEKAFKIGEEILSRLNDKLDIVFLCNPNNPTGQLIDPIILRKILDHCMKMDILLVVDECFLDFLEEPDKHTLQSYLSDYTNLFLLRAFTKSYAMPGLRLGYGLCSDQELLSAINISGQPWSVSTIAQQAGIQALKEKKYLLAARELIFSERKHLCEALTTLGYRVWQPEANYIFFRVLCSPATFQEELAREGILVRCCENYHGLKQGYFRIAVKTAEENQKLINVLKRREARWQKQL